MPFGDKPRTMQATVGRSEFGPGLHAVPCRRVRVPKADPPWWWSEYLTDEWKRKNHYKQQPRDGRSQWKCSEDTWRAQLRCWELEDFGAVGNKPGLTRDVHAIWTTGDDA